MKFFKTIWRTNGALFDWIQRLFNDNFWEVFEKKFGTLLTGNVLDLGCGTGTLALHIKPRRYVGMDTNEYYLSHARRIVTAPNTTFIHGDILGDLPRGPFGVACLISITHHLSDKQLTQLLQRLRTQKIHSLLVVETLPKVSFKNLLQWLDAQFGDGEYFRTPEEMKARVLPYFRIKKEGVLKAKFSFYTYPYLLASLS